MAIVGTTKVRCPGCGTERDCQLVQSINTRTSPDAKLRLLDGTLNVLACECGRRTSLAANVLFVDPDADYYCQVCPCDDAARARAAETFRAVAATGTQRLVPSLNALVEKVKILDAGLADWAIEMTKVLLLASIGELDRVLLFDRLEPETATIHWVLFDEEGRRPEGVASPASAYEKLAARAQGQPPAAELQIDRAWALEAVRTMIADAN